MACQGNFETRRQFQRVFEGVYGAQGWRGAAFNDRGRLVGRFWITTSAHLCTLQRGR